MAAATPTSPERLDLLLQKPRHSRFSHLLIWLVGALGAWPLFGVIPSMDWPQHVAIVDILSRLWIGDTRVAVHFAPHLQPVAYHLLYVIWTPLAVVMGTQSAGRLLLLLLYAANFGVIARAVAHLRGPNILQLAAIPLFYGVNFVWGFAPTMVGTGPMLICLCLLCMSSACSRRLCIATGLSAACATFAHIVFWPVCCAASIVSLVIHGPSKRRLALACTCASTLVALPGLWQVVWRHLGAEHSAGGNTLSFESSGSGLRHLGLAMRCLDRSWHQAGQVLCVAVVVAALSWPGRRPADASRRSFVMMAVMLLGLVWVIPLTIEGASGSSWLLNVRFVSLALAMAVLASATSPLWFSRWAPYAHGVWVVACCSMAIGAVRLSLAYREEVAPYLKAVQAHPLHGRLAVMVTPQPFRRVWPPLTRHMAALAFTGRLDWQADLFVGGHLPVVERHPQIGRHIQTAAAEWLLAWRSDVSTDAALQASHSLWTLCDALLVQDDAVGRGPNPPTSQASVIARGKNWLLLAPPANQLHPSLCTD